MKKIVLILVCLISTTSLHGYEKDSAISVLTIFNKWQFIGFQDVSTGEKDLLPNDIKVNIEFLSSNKMKPWPHNIEGKAPCNEYYGVFEISKKNGLTFNSMKATNKGCMRKNRKKGERSMMEWERLYFKSLRNAESCKIINHELRISFNKNNEIMLYKLAHRTL